MLELTESVAHARRRRGVLAAARRSKALGVRLAIDDFGTGYSSLSYLHRFPVDILKIAKPFVDGLGHGEAEEAFAATMVKLAEALDLVVVAEGIEEAEQRDGLRALGCALGQGYYFARPLPETEARAYLERRLRAAA